jgi:probable selenium-dependent hydroxylase accessory protein YqeC
VGMTLERALSLGNAELVCLVGAGGKTSLLRQLALECTDPSTRILVTTSTKMFQSELESCGPLTLEPDVDVVLAAHQHQKGGLACAASVQASNGKVIGYTCRQLDRFHGSGLFHRILVEADGARGKNLKAPGAHDPVVPSSATIVVLVVGLHALGRPLSEAQVHRPDGVAALTQQQIGSQITGDTLARILDRYSAVTETMAPLARFVPVLNQVDTPEQLRLASRMARAWSSSHRVVITSMCHEDCVRAVVQP